MKERLTTLFELQLIDNQLDELEQLRGDLPAIVNELNSKLDSLMESIVNKENQKTEAQERRNANEAEIETLSQDVKRFKSQLSKVRNNKEYDALTKQIDYADDKIKALIKENIELENQAEMLKNETTEISPKVDELKDEIKEKETELKKIIQANEREEAIFLDKRKVVVEKVKKNDLNTYTRIRKACDGIAVAVVSRKACAGCNNVVPPQRQLEIKQNKRIYTCESCGRMLISEEAANEVKSRLKF
ncbi:MAG: hypothetical protein JW866_07225 [Ignavibacteriales bacterium]|nr:hypothetical protein [Ignavibacteriales bacterium]